MVKLKDSFFKLNMPVNFGLFTLYSDVFNYEGDDVKDKDCIIVSDMIDTGKIMLE